MKSLQREASVSQIHSLVESHIGKVPSSSVRSYLRLRPDMFERTRRGRYQLAEIGTTRLASADTVKRTSAIEKVFEYGQAQLFHNDCFDWLEVCSENSIHAVVTDPPYGLVEYSEKEQRKLRLGKGGVWRNPPSFDGHRRSPLPRFTTLDEKDLLLMYDFFCNFGRAISKVLVPGAHLFVATNPLVCHIVASALADSGLESRGMIYRLVKTMRGGDRPKNAHKQFPNVTVMPRSMAEPWLLFRKPLEGRVQDNLRKWATGGLRRHSQHKPFGDVITSHPTHASERRLAPHPSLKPQDFLRQLVRACLPLERGTILDPFAGAGSTLAAANHFGYTSIGIEKSSEYVNMAIEAIPKLAKLKCPDKSSSI